MLRNPNTYTHTPTTQVGDLSSRGPLYEARALPQHPDPPAHTTTENVLRASSRSRAVAAAL
jgi:hypothetical protein